MALLISNLGKYFQLFLQWLYSVMVLVLTIRTDLYGHARSLWSWPYRCFRLRSLVLTFRSYRNSFSARNSDRGYITYTVLTSLLSPPFPSPLPRNLRFPLHSLSPPATPSFTLRSLAQSFVYFPFPSLLFPTQLSLFPLLTPLLSVPTPAHFDLTCPAPGAGIGVLSRILCSSRYCHSCNVIRMNWILAN